MYEQPLRSWPCLDGTPEAWQHQSREKVTQVYDDFPVDLFLEPPPLHPTASRVPLYTSLFRALLRELRRGAQTHRQKRTQGA